MIPGAGLACKESAIEQLVASAASFIGHEARRVMMSVMLTWAASILSDAIIHELAVPVADTAAIQVMVHRSSSIHGSSSSSSSSSSSRRSGTSVVVVVIVVVVAVV